VKCTQKVVRPEERNPWSKTKTWGNE